MKDPLSDVLVLLDVRNFTAGAIDAAGAWSLQFAAYKGVKCYAVDPQLHPTDFREILSTSVENGVAYVNGGGDCFIAGGQAKRAI